MTATRTTSRRAIGLVDTAETVDVAREVSEFLQDPIGYGTYDYDDPISLAQFSTTSHFHRRYVSSLV